MCLQYTRRNKFQSFAQMLTRENQYMFQIIYKAAKNRSLNVGYFYNHYCTDNRRNTVKEEGNKETLHRKTATSSHTLMYGWRDCNEWNRPALGGMMVVTDDLYVSSFLAIALDSLSDRGTS